MHKSLLYGLPLAGASFGALILSVADRYMLEFIRGSSEVGNYSAGYDLADKTLKVLFTVLIASSFPIVMETLSRRGSLEAHRLINRLLRVYIVWMVPTTVMMIGFRKEVVRITLGEQFGSASVVLPWVAIGTLCWGATQILAQSFQIQEDTKPLLYWILAAAGLNVVLNLWLIPRYGVVGAAIATTMAYGAYVTVLWTKRIRTPAYRVGLGEIVKVLSAGIAMYVSMIVTPSIVRSQWLVSVARAVIGVSVYALSLRVVGRSLFDEGWQQVRTWVKGSPSKR
jgi:O-antigen/teichoic acid export membrane protein